MTVYDSYTILNPTPGKYEADHPLVIGVNQSRVKSTINVPEIFAAGRYYFRGVNTIISGVVASDAGKPAYIEANLQDGEIGAGTLTLLSVHGVEANFSYSIKHVPLFETEIDASEIDTSGLVTKDTFNSTVARIDADIQKGDTDLRLDLDALTSRFTQLSSEVNAELDTFDESLGQIETEVKNLADEVDGYDARITNAENAASSANTVAQAASSAASAAQTTADEAKTNADDAVQRAINAIKNLAPSYSLEGPKTQTLDSSYRAVLEGVDLTSSYWLEVVAGATNQLFSALTVIITSNNTLNTRIILDGSIKGDAGNLMFTAAILPMFGLVDIQPIDDKNFASSRAGRPPSGTSRIGKITVIAKGTEVAGATIRLYRIVTNYGG